MLIAGIVLILLNVAAIAPAATGAVEDVVDETFASYTKDTICADADCTEAEEDWASSTAQRDYYAWDVTNLADVMAGEAPITEKVGPFTYDITTTRTINNYDANAGELTYNAVKTFDCAADSAVSCDKEVTQLNILFQAQVIGATGMALEVQLRVRMVVCVSTQPHRVGIDHTFRRILITGAISEAPAIVVTGPRACCCKC